MTTIIKSLFRRLGVQITRVPRDQFPLDFDCGAKEIIRAVQPYTMTSPDRLYSLIEAVRYLHKTAIEGDLVECGVWRGGSMMAAALCLMKLGDWSRSMYLYDTYQGMPRPRSVDTDLLNRPADEMFLRAQSGEEFSRLCDATYKEVRENILSTGYPEGRVHFVKGKVENTLPVRSPKPIAFLRLDTDWYESTKCELEHLYDQLAPGGILIIDDYGHWRGCRKAVDEFFALKRHAPFLHRIDYTGRLLIKGKNDSANGDHKESRHFPRGCLSNLEH